MQTSKPKIPDLFFSNKQLWQIIWPLLIEQILQISLGIADIFMVSSLGEAAVSGVSLVDQINVLLTSAFAALATGGAVVCSQYIGRKDERNSQETARQVLLVVSAVSVFLMVIGLFIYKPVLKLIFGSIEAEVMDASQRYFLISLYAIPGIAIYNAAAALFRSNGNSRISMIITILINILNIGGNALLIFGFKMYVEGVAWPTFISRTVAAVILLILLYFEKGNFGDSKAKSHFISIKGISKTRPKGEFIGKILRIGVPNMMENSSFQFGKVIVLNVVTLFGTGAIAANAAGNTLAGVEVISGSAIGLCMLTVVGQCLGAGRKDQAVYYTKKLLLWAYVSFAAINIPFLLSSHWILSFLGLAEDTINAAWAIVLTHGILGMVFWCLSFCLPNALRAAGDAAYTMVFSMLSMWIIRVGLSFVFQKTRLCGLMDYFNLPDCYGALCVWFAMICDWIVRIVFILTRIISGKWLNKKVI